MEKVFAMSGNEKFDMSRFSTAATDDDGGGGGGGSGDQKAQRRYAESELDTCKCYFTSEVTALRTASRGEALNCFFVCIRVRTVKAGIIL